VFQILTLYIWLCTEDTYDNSTASFGFTKWKKGAFEHLSDMSFPKKTLFDGISFRCTEIHISYLLQSSHRDVPLFVFLLFVETAGLAFK